MLHETNKILRKIPEGNAQTKGGKCPFFRIAKAVKVSLSCPHKIMGRMQQTEQNK